jgi:hypothetical protein
MPLHDPRPDRAATVTRQLHGHLRRTRSGNACPGWSGGGDPAGRGGGGFRSRRGAQQKGAGLAPPGGKREPARSAKIDAAIGVADLPDDRADGAAAQGFLHRPQHVAGFRRGDGHQPLGGKIELIETGSIRRAVLDEPHVLRNPQHRARIPCAGRKHQCKSGRGGNRALARSGDFMQRGAGKTAAERIVDRRNPQRDCRARLHAGVRLDRPDGVLERAHHAPVPASRGGRKRSNEVRRQVQDDHGEPSPPG